MNVSRKNFQQYNWFSTHDTKSNFAQLKIYQVQMFPRTIFFLLRTYTYYEGNTVKIWDFSINIYFAIPQCDPVVLPK